MVTGFAWSPAASLRPQSIKRVTLSVSVTPSLHIRVQESFACFPSTTPFGLALGPDYPREDEPSSGDLGPSVRGILTHVPLLTPAFSLPCAPHALSVMLLRCMQCSPTTFLSIASVSCLAPVNYRRRVIRLVSCYALFEGWLLLSQPPSCLHVSTSFST